MLNSLLSDDEVRARFERTIAILRDSEARVTAEAIYSLSDLYGERLQAFRGVWAEIPVERRRTLITRLVETAETNFELDFSAIIHAALHDDDSEVRLAAIEGVLEESPHTIIERLITLAQSDPFAQVRASAAKTLGMFVLRGELGELPQALNTRLQDAMWALYTDFEEDLDVRRRALEALGNCGREGVQELIHEAYYADELLMRVSAIFAMGRSCDAMWQPMVLDELTSEYPEMRYEAARAAGELELRSALSHLAELAYEEDREIQEMAIWALGEIGGNEAVRILNDLAALAEENEDEELADAVEEAQGAALLGGDDLPLFDFSEYADGLTEEHTEYLSLEDLRGEANEDTDPDDEA